MSTHAAKIHAREFMAYRAEIKADIFRQIHKRLAYLKSKGLTQKMLAEILGWDEGQLSRCLKGLNDLRLETLSDLARALGCRIKASLSPLDSATEGAITFKVHPNPALPSNPAKTATVPSSTSIAA